MAAEDENKGDGMDMKRIFAAFALIAVCMAGVAFAATTDTSSSSAVLQISDYSTLPATAYPGTNGYAKFTISNTGSDTATGLTVYYTYMSGGTPLSFSAGDISAGSSSQLTVPFKIPQQVSTGMYQVNVDVYYTSSSGGQSKKTSISIPIVVSQAEILEVSTTSLGRNALAPGETLELGIQVRNTGGVINNLVVSAPQNSSFSIEGTTEKPIGTIASGASQNVTLRLVSSSTASVGQYTIPLVFTYQDALGTTETQTLYVGPVSILEPSTQFRLSMVPLTSAEVGSQASFALTIENTGTTELNAIVDMNSTGVFMPLGVTRVYFDPIAPGQSASKNVLVGVSSSASAGYYELPITVTLGSGTTAKQSVGIPVSATPEVTISVDTTQSQSMSPGSDGKVLVQISNTGNSAIRSVYATAGPGDFKITGSSDKFIGTLNVDDFATFQLSVSVPQNTKAGSHAIPVTITFKDTNNQVHTVKKNIEVQVYGAGMAGSTGTTSNATGFNGRAAQNSGLFGIGWLPLGIIAAVLIVSGYFGYRHFFKNKGEKKAGMAGHQHESEKNKERSQ